MERPVISVFHHKFGVSVAVVHGEDPAAYWARVDGYEGGDGEQWLESFDLAMPFAAAPEMLAALKVMVRTFGWLGSPDRRQPEVEAAMVAINKAEGRVG
jgi:hypothetical protein